MAATADPRAKPPVGPAAHHLEPWARQQQPPRAHRVRVAARPAAEEESTADRDRRPSSNSQRRGAADADGEGGVEDLRAKLMGHLRHAADRIREVQASPPLPPPPPKPVSLLLPERKPSPVPTAPAPAPVPHTQQQQEDQQQADVADKPWKLRERTRRRPASLLTSSWPAAPSSKSRRRKRARFSVSLAPEEIEEDIYALTGGRPRRRPRKRPRAVQRQLDSLLPGKWLTEITADDYKVPEPEE